MRPRDRFVVMQRAVEAIDFELAANVVARDGVDTGEFMLAADPRLQLIERDVCLLAHATTPSSLRRSISFTE